MKTYFKLMKFLPTTVIILSLLFFGFGCNKTIKQPTTKTQNSTNQPISDPVAKTGDESKKEGLPIVKYEDGKIKLSNSKWILDTYDKQQEGNFVIFSAYQDIVGENSLHTNERPDQKYGIYRYNTQTGETKELYYQNKWLGRYGYASLNQFTGAAIRFSPDDQKFFWSVTPSFYWEKSLVVMTVQGVSIPTIIAGENIDWFTNSALSFAKESYSNNGVIYILDLETGKESPTRIPSSSWTNLNPKVNPTASAYVSQQVVTNSGEGYTCFPIITNLVVYSYPDRKELFRIDKIQEVKYRWLNGNNLEITYRPAAYTTSKNTNETCLPQKTITYTLP